MMASPTSGSASGQPSATPAAPATTAQGGQPVGARVQPVGDQRRRADLAPDPDPVLRDELVAEEADHAGRGHPPQVLHRRGIEQAAHRLHPGHDRRGGNHDHDEQAGEVLSSPVPVRVAAVRWPTPEPERHPQRDGGAGVGDVVHGVSEQRDRPRERHHGALQDGGDQQGDEADLQRPDAAVAGLQRGVDEVGGVVAVR